MVLGAQAHLHDWYARFGFVQDGEQYLEDGIAHIPMRQGLSADGRERARTASGARFRLAGVDGTARRGGPAQAELHLAQRRLQDLLAGAALPAPAAHDVTRRLGELNALLEAHQVREHERVDGLASRPARPRPSVAARLRHRRRGARACCAGA